MFIALSTRGSLNGIWCLTHWSYTVGPAVRSNTSSIQSVAGQPVATPDAMPAHHGLTPSFAIRSLRLSISCHVRGTLYPLSRKNFGEYQTSDLTLPSIGTAYRRPLTVP